MDNCSCGSGGCVCQSCGMPMKEDKDYATFEGGEKSCEYCVYCMQDGQYLVEAENIEEFVKKVRAKMLEMGMSEEQVEESVEMMIPILPTLKRWQ